MELKTKNIMKAALACRSMLMSTALITVLFILSPAAVLADASFSCNSRIVNQGDLMSEVRAKCGEPADISRRTESQFTSRHDKNSGIEQGISVTIEIEEWVYNFGPHQFIRRLTFRDGKLVRIETGDYGY